MTYFIEKPDLYTTELLMTRLLGTPGMRALLYHNWLGPGVARGKRNRANE
jgi:hypothetical protein